MFTCPASDAKKALQRCKPALSKNGALPVLSGVRFDAGPEGVTATVTDLDLTVVAPLPATVTEPGAVVVPYATLAKLFGKVKTSSRATFTLTVADGNAVADVDGLSVTVPVLPLDEWPRPPALPTTEYPVPDGALADVLPAVHAANQGRPIEAVLFDGPTGDIVTCDSFRIHLFSGGPVLPEQVLIPGRLAEQAAKMTGAVLRYEQGNRFVAFTAEGCTVYGRAVEGEYPRFRTLIPEALPERVLFTDPAATVQAIAEVGGFATANEPLRIDHDPEGVRLSLHCDGTVVARTVPGTMPDYGTLAYNPRFLRELFTGLDADELALDFLDGQRPALLRHGNRTRLLMPVRTS